MIDKDTAVIILAAVVLLVTVVGFATTFLAILLVSKETTKIPEILNRLVNTEMILTQLAEDVNLEMRNDQTPELWKTADGKYQGMSFEDLLQKMSLDPDGPLTSDEIDAIKSVFDKIAQNPDDDDDSPQEPWRKK
jgi:hypothetical protein